VDDIDAAKFFFDDLADANGCDSAEQHGRHIFASQIVTVGGFGGNTREEDTEHDVSQNLVPNLTETVYNACTCIGIQRIAMGRDHNISRRKRTDQETRTAEIELCALCLEDVQTDLLITLTMPHVTKSDNAEGTTDMIRMMQGESKEGVTGADGQVSHGSLFQNILKIFVVNDWTLFACFVQLKNGCNILILVLLPAAVN